MRISIFHVCENFISPYFSFLGLLLFFHLHVYLFSLPISACLTRDINSLLILLWCKCLLSPLPFHSVLLLLFFFLCNCYVCCHVLKILPPKFWKCFSILLFLTTLAEQPRGAIVWDTVCTNISLQNGLSAGAPICPFLQSSLLSYPASSWNLCARAAPCPCPFRI